jgi:hypothetical protein
MGLVLQIEKLINYTCELSIGVPFGFRDPSVLSACYPALFVILPRCGARMNFSAKRQDSFSHKEMPQS